MDRKILLGLLFFFSILKLAAQEKKSNFAIGFNYGFGSEFNNRNYTFTNNFYKAQLYYQVKKTSYFEFEILVQPEVNFGTHQLLNFYFVQPSEPDYLEKRERFTKLKDVHEYVLNLGFLVRKPIGGSCSFYVLGSVGPMINDTETERMSEGFAFADVFAVGFSVKVESFQFDVRPSIRHVSNAGFNDKNSGYNTRNIEFGVSYGL
ncbi:outer membrane beta-barrel protein [Flavobacterium sp. GA093]|uniref:Outer membrane beta-barrel protein n=1 Tax=Flavobacterium hydrocarbonoxydans TaxID=2683249 RepID=A0A6I4NQL9_9FLAO|nr:acyloxyacyl hydrolase [Flavobacterium hydrocarbonoxydans]MWB96503.1 outer membrane beta-barrel protein [Flavobacterium hydrocarbonoxydans]